MKMNNKGQGLLETLLALGLGSIICITALMSIFLIIKASRYTQYSSEDKAEAALFTDVIAKYISRGINVKWTGGPIGNVTGDGQLRVFKSGFSKKERAPILVGAYLRETGRPVQSHSTSDIRATAIFFMEPTPVTPGRIFLSTSDRGESGDINLSSDTSELVFENIVEFEISRGGLTQDPNGSVRVAELRVVHRKFLDPDTAKWWWCPDSVVGANPGCNRGASAKDTETTILIPMYNNAITTNRKVMISATRAEPAIETIMGDLYLYDLVVR